MNYWGVEAANLGDCHEPLIQFMREVSINGQKTAQQMYHFPGWVMHHNTSLWRDTQPVDWFSYVSFWPMGGGWLCEDLWEHYQFKPDLNYLRNTAYPIMKGAATFYQHWLVDDGKGHLLTPVSDSPENMFYYNDKNGKQVMGGLTMGSTMDMAIIRELFTNCIKSARLLNIDAEWRKKLEGQLQELLPYQIGSRGQILEYYKEYKEVPPRHNTSPYYPLFPSGQITPRHTPELAAAEQKLMEERGGRRAGGGFPGAWLATDWARLNRGDTSIRFINALVGHNHPNFFNGSGKVFQIDANMGGYAAIGEMLLQSHAGEIELLPALPASWDSGSVKGLCARGGFEAGMTWKNGVLTIGSVKSTGGTSGVVRYGEKTVKINLKKGETIRLNADLKTIK
jgi:alpha-L-fucosidase 2